MRSTLFLISHWNVVLIRIHVCLTFQYCLLQICYIYCALEELIFYYRKSYCQVICPGSGLRIQQFVQHDFTVNISLNFAIILEGERTLSTLQILSVFQTQITGKHPSFPNESVEEEWICWMRSAPICIPGGRTWYFPLVDFNKCEKYASFWKAYQIWSIWMNLNSRKNHRSVISFSHRNAFLSRFNNDKKIRKFDIFPFFNNTKKK